MLRKPVILAVRQQLWQIDRICVLGLPPKLLILGAFRYKRGKFCIRAARLVSAIDDFSAMSVATICCFCANSSKRFLRFLQPLLQLLDLIFKKDFGGFIRLEPLVDIECDEGVSIGVGDLLRPRRVGIGVTEINQARVR